MRCASLRSALQRCGAVCFVVAVAIFPPRSGFALRSIFGTEGPLGVRTLEHVNGPQKGAAERGHVKNRQKCPEHSKSSNFGTPMI